MNFLPDVKRYDVGTGGSSAGGPGEGGSDLLLANREVVGVGGEVAGCAGRGWGSREEVV